MLAPRLLLTCGAFLITISAPLSAQDTDFAKTKKLAESGNAKAQSNLGYMYAKGEGVPKDAAEAVKWYRKAADQGYAKAQTNLGYMYANGEGVPKDAAEAYTWFNLASISDDYSRKSRDELEKSLSPEQKVRAQQRSTELHKEIEARKKAAGK